MVHKRSQDFLWGELLFFLQKSITFFVVVLNIKANANLLNY